MKLGRVFLAIVLMAFAAVAAKADGIDPTVIIRKTDPAPILITSPTQIFSFTATALDNIVAFQNDTGTTLDSLTLDLFGIKVSLTFSCGSFAGGGIFADCSSTPGSHGDTFVTFSGVGGDFTGITPATCTTDDEGKGDDEHSSWADSHDSDDKTSCTGGVYSLEFGGIPIGDKIGGTGSFVTPEPTTALILLSGLAGLALRRRRSS